MLLIFLKTFGFVNLSCIFVFCFNHLCLIIFVLQFLKMES